MSKLTIKGVCVCNLKIILFHCHSRLCSVQLCLDQLVACGAPNTSSQQGSKRMDQLRNINTHTVVDGLSHLFFTFHLSAVVINDTCMLVNS